MHSCNTSVRNHLKYGGIKIGKGSFFFPLVLVLGSGFLIFRLFSFFFFLFSFSSSSSFSFFSFLFSLFSLHFKLLRILYFFN